MVNDRHRNDFWHQIPGLKFPGKRSYQVTVALVFGLIGFGVNFLDIEFLKTGDFKISILLGVFFPLLIALAWGWRYGLLCALAGGCQTMWWALVRGRLGGPLLGAGLHLMDCLARLVGRPPLRQLSLVYDLVCRGDSVPYY
ncbi:MAG: hypothetical protein PHG14_12785 [Desulfobacter postgatei]|uniref:hypothetical protein n=1 Tax=Desulfobacter postgatei TaxID=2293 RepID=UPI0023F51471|nr:hypothetical protein [Desulfobacter postgatei]MDD4274584.1 hypothetical protein [Desulfobacter postgatei]